MSLLQRLLAWLRLPFEMSAPPPPPPSDKVVTLKAKAARKRKDA